MGVNLKLHVTYGAVYAIISFEYYVISQPRHPGTISRVSEDPPLRKLHLDPSKIVN